MCDKSGRESKEEEKEKRERERIDTSCLALVIVAQMNTFGFSDRNVALFCPLCGMVKLTKDKGGVWIKR